MRTRHPPRRQAGFTLVEMLIALTLLGLVFVMIFGGLRFGTRSWDAVIGETRERDRTVATQAFLRARLGEFSRPAPSRSGRSAVAGDISGEEDRLEFSAPWLAALSVGGLYTFSLRLDETEQGGRLILAWRPVGEDSADDDLGETTGERVLLDGIERLGFAYYGALETGGEPDWVRGWPKDAPAPKLVSIDIDFRDPGRTWPPFVVHPAR